MDLVRFINLLAASVGLMGAIFLAIGVLVLNNERTMDLCFNYSPLSWPSTAIVESLAAKKAHTVVGVFFIVVAFLLQVATIIFSPDKKVDFIDSRLGCVVLGASAILVLLFILYFADKGLAAHHERDMKKIATRRYMEKWIERGAIDLPAIEGLDAISYQYFRIGRSTSESKAAFVRRMAEYVALVIPVDLDFSRIEKND